MEGGAGSGDQRSSGARAEGGGPPSVFHLTHWKAGSSWLTRILRRLDRERIVQPRQSATSLVAQFLEDPVLPARVYPRLYVTREEFERVALPAHWRGFVVVRDLRDTLVSAYFSVKLSHGENPLLDEGRERLQSLDADAGMEWMLDHFMVARSAEIQRSWCGSDLPLHRFEELIADEERLARLLGDLELEPDPARVRRVIERTRFERLSGGRAPGEEDVRSHFRRGVPGDWRNHFGARLTDLFKQRWGELLIATGHERDLDW